MVGVHQSNVSRGENISIMQTHNTYIPDQRYKISKEQEEEIFNRIKDGESQSQIAADYGISQPRVSQIVKKVSKQKGGEKMSEQTRTTIATEILLDLQEAIANSDEQSFMSVLREKKTILNNAIVGDAYLQERYIAVLRAGLEKFIG